MTRLVLGVDCSTTACKAIVWGEDGAPLGEGRAPIALDNPAPDAWEQDAERYVSATIEAVRGALSAAGDGAASRVEAMCVTHQRETIVLADQALRPLAPAIVWMDARCTGEVAAASKAMGEERIHALSGKVPCTTPSMYKVMHALASSEELRRARPMVLDVHAFLVGRLTGERATSLASADPTGLVDMARRAWSQELVELAGLSLEQLPRLVEPGQKLGELSAEAARATGLPEGLAVVAGAGDGQAAGLGAGITSPGRAYLNLGTALVSGVLSRDYRLGRAFRTLYGALPGTYLLETDLKGGTFTLTWLIERVMRCSPEESPSVIAGLDRLARAVPPGASGLLLVPYWAGVMNPFWDDDASGMLVGLRGDHGPAEIFRAVLEGLSLEQRLHLEGVERATGEPLRELVVMGGGAKSDLFCQIVADVTGKRVVRSRSAEATCLGAGVLASAWAGLHRDVSEAARAMTATGEAFEPGELRGFYDRLFSIYQGLYPALSPSLRALARLRRGQSLLP